MDFEHIISKLIEDGISQVGFCSVEGLLPERYSNFKFAVSLVYKLSDGIVEEVREKSKPTFAYFQHYRTVNAFLDQKSLWVAGMLEREGFRSMPIAASQSVKDMGEYTGIFQHKTAAVHSGLGWIGKSALFVSPLYGPRVRLATVLTEMPLPNLFHEELVGAPTGCDGCKVCVDNCPAMAITGKNYIQGESNRSDVFDPKACSEHMKKEYQQIGRGAVCGICMASCPFGGHTTISAE